MRPANRALVGNRERAAFHVVSGNLPVARLCRELLQFPGDFQNGFFVHVPDHRHQQSLIRVHRDAEVEIFLDDDFIRHLVEARIENRMLLQSFNDCFQNERRQRQLHAFGLVSRAEFFTQLVQPREIRLVELRHAGDGIPAFPHPPRDDLPQLRQRLFDNRTPLRKINGFGNGLCRRRSAG